MELEIIPGRYAVCRLQPDAVQPIWARSPAGTELLSVTWSDAELSVVCPEERVPSGVPCERGFTVLRARGRLDLSLTGVLASLTVPLSRAAIPVFALSTHDTDYVLLRAEDIEQGIEALTAAGHLVALGEAEESQEMTGRPPSRAARGAFRDGNGSGGR
jgi:hypothetical protein